MASDFEHAFRQVLAPVATNLGFAVTTCEDRGRCRELKLSKGNLELHVFDDVMGETTISLKFTRFFLRQEKDYAAIIRKTTGSDFELKKFLGGWTKEGLLPANLQKSFAIIADTLPAVTKRYA